VLGLGTRIENFEVFDGQGTRIEVRKKAPGQFESSSPATEFKYEVNLASPVRSSDAALVSWLSAERGVLMLGDLLPVDVASRANVQIEALAGWSVSSAEIEASPNEFKVGDSDRTVIAVGRNLRVSRRSVEGSQFTLVTDGDWAFQDSEALDLAAKILKTYVDLAGSVPCRQAALFLLPYQSPIAADKWNAQTRGCTVSLVMGKQPSRVGALSQLGNALTHELFHLWIPNGLALQGDYDWFYEGFTVYQAARTAVRMDLLTFAELMTAIARAYDGISSVSDVNQLSLVEASKRRWTTGASAVYSKAMVIAFLYDLNLRYQSKGKRSLDDVYRNIFRSQKTGGQSSSAQSADGNAVATAALGAQLEPSFVQRFVNEPVNIDLQTELARFGLRVEKFGFRTRIVVGEKLTSRQRDLLRELGYNDRTR
jgi:predicted metalloprotease with PDZ domain